LDHRSRREREAGAAARRCSSEVGSPRRRRRARPYLPSQAVARVQRCCSIGAAVLAIDFGSAEQSVIRGIGGGRALLLFERATTWSTRVTGGSAIGRRGQLVFSPPAVRLLVGSARWSERTTAIGVVTSNPSRRPCHGRPEQRSSAAANCAEIDGSPRGGAAQDKDHDQHSMRLVGAWPRRCSDAAERGEESHPRQRREGSPPARGPFRSDDGQGRKHGPLYPEHAQNANSIWRGYSDDDQRAAIGGGSAG
jgi:hypothetical protein